ncbi:MAG: methyl-accepting chemotaxis protein, partial [bacterium]|nr:methyl-accepting chemotaxis protein [bacterium]
MKISFRGVTAKIWVSVGIALLGYMLSTFLSYLSNNDLSHNLARLSSSDFPLSHMGVDLVHSYGKQVKYYEDAVLLGEEDAFKLGRVLSKRMQALYREMTETARESANPVELEIIGLRKRYEKYLEFAPAFSKLSQGEDGEELQKQVQEAKKLQIALQADMEKTVTGLKDTVRAKIEQEKNNAERNSKVQVIMFIVVFLLSLILIKILSHRLLVSPIKKILAGIQEFVTGFKRGDADLTHRMEHVSKDEIDEITEVFNRFIEKVQDMVGKVKGATDEIIDSALDISGGSEELSTRNSQQGASISGTSEHLEVVTA